MTNSSKVGKIHHFFRFAEPSISMGHGLTMAGSVSQDLQSYSRALDACSGARRWEEALGLVQDVASMWRRFGGQRV